MAWSCSICYLAIQFLTFYQIAFLLGINTNAQDPCTTHLTLTDVTMTTDYVQGPQNPLRYGDLIDNFKWYRYTSTAQGVLASTAPQGTQCLSENQIWSSDPIPSIGCTTFITFCVKDNTSPCAQQGRMQAKNCGAFVVYQLSIPRGSKARFCFEGHPPISPKPTQKPCTSTSSSPTSTSLPSTLSITAFSTRRQSGYTLTNTTVIHTSTMLSTSSIRLTLSTTVPSTPISSTTTLPTTRTSTLSATTPTTVPSTKPASFSTTTPKVTTTPLHSTSRTHTTFTTTSSRKTSSLSSKSTNNFISPSTTLMASSILTSTKQSARPAIGYTKITQQTRIAPDKATTNTHASQDRLKPKQASAGLIAGIVVCSIVLVCSLVVIVWKVFGRQMYTVSQSLTLRTDPLRNAKPKFDVHRL